MADIHDLTTPGWEGVNAESPLPVDEPENYQQEIDRAIARVLDTADGKLMFDWLVGSYLRQPTWAPGYATDFGYYREGQNTLIREIALRAERAKADG
jgi:hypothetical protein